MHTFFHYGDQLPFALQVSLGVICVFCVFANVLSSKTLLPFVFRKNFIKSVLKKFSYLMIGCGKTNLHIYFHYRDQSPLALQVSLGIICVFCVLAHVVVKKPFCLSRMYTPFPWGCTHSIKAPRLGLGGHRPAAKFIGEMTMKFSSFKVLFFKLYKRF